MACLSAKLGEVICGLSVESCQLSGCLRTKEALQTFGKMLSNRMILEHSNLFLFHEILSINVVIGIIAFISMYGGLFYPFIENDIEFIIRNPFYS